MSTGRSLFVKNIAGGKGKCGTKPRNYRKDMTQPDWATPIIEEVCLAHKRRIPNVKWLKRNRLGTSGVTYRSHIVMCAGREELDQKQVLLHELSHWILAKRSRKGHSVAFWKKLFHLLKQYECLTEGYVQREFRYMKKAELVYNQL